MSVFGKKMFLSLLVFLVILMETQYMQYHEPVDVDDLNSMFDDDGCIDGLLSISETGSPIINQMSFSNVLLVTSNKDSKILLDNKSPISLIAELATFNNIHYMFSLEEEQGPEHKKKFGVYLDLGSERYFGEGRSIKEAQNEASKLALNSTTYAHPPENPIADKPTEIMKTSADRVLKLAEKLEIPIAFHYNEPSTDDENDASHEYKKYFKLLNQPTVTIKIGARKFVKGGKTIEIAKEKASIEALKYLNDVDGFCWLNKNDVSFVDKLLFRSLGNQDDSPISILHAFSSKTKTKILFELIGEEGPAHIKNFIYKCSAEGKYEFIGEGSSKKAAKLESANKMLNHLKSLIPFPPEECQNIIKKKRNNKRTHLVKNVKKVLDDEEEKPKINIPDNINPISKLIQIQQAKHDILPSFRLKEEKSQGNSKEFLIEVFIGDISFVGSGHNKKIAKRKAAEGMLELLGYSSMNRKTTLSSSAKKKKVFIRNYILKRKPILSGLNIGPTYFETEKLLNNQPANSANDPVHQNIKVGRSDRDKTKQKSDIDSKRKLENLSQQLGFRFQFSDFPKVKDSGFVSLLSLTTRPPRICYGMGPSTEVSQNEAARNAVKNLFNNEFDKLSKIFDDPAPSESKDFYEVEENIEDTIIHLETE